MTIPTVHDARYQAIILDAWLRDGDAEVQRNNDNVITIRTLDGAVMIDHLMQFGHFNPVTDDYVVNPA